MIKVVGFMIFIIIVVLVNINKNNPPNSNVAPREYTILVHKDTAWVYDGKKKVSRVMIYWNSPLDSFLKLDNPPVPKTDTVDNY